MDKPNERDSNYDVKTNDSKYEELFFYIKGCVEEWITGRTYDPTCIIDREFSKELKKYIIRFNI